MNESNMTSREIRDLEKQSTITFLHYEVLRLDNREPSAENEEDKKAILKTLDYLESNRDILKIK